MQDSHFNQEVETRQTVRDPRLEIWLWRRHFGASRALKGLELAARNGAPNAMIRPMHLKVH